LPIEREVVMHRSIRLTFSFVVVMAAFVATPATAEGNYWQPAQPDESMCQDMTGNWVMCDSMGGEGISGGGGGGGAEKCTGIGGCNNCVRDPFTLNQKYCKFTDDQDGVCKCWPSGPGTCSTSGTCTYIRFGSGGPP
jgi:hypothetical protein